MPAFALDTVLHTDGSGYWSERAAAVRVYCVDLYYANEENTCGSVDIYFDKKTWNIEEDGLIYTDELFMRELRAALAAHGIDASDIDYSEQGLQGDFTVNIDVGSAFLATYPLAA